MLPLRDANSRWAGGWLVPQPIEDLTRLHRRATTGRQLSPAGGNVEVGREYGTDDGGWPGELYRFTFETMTCFFSQRLGQDLISILCAKTQPRLLGRRNLVVQMRLGSLVMEQ